MTQVVSDKAREFLEGLKSADGLFAIDESQQIVYWSESAQQILGYAPADVIGRRCYEIVGGKDSRNFRFCRRNCPIIVNARRGRATPNYDVLVRGRDGQYKWINMTILLHGGQQAQPSFVLHIFRDVGERRRIEEAASRAMTSLREFLLAEEKAPTVDTEPAQPPAPDMTRRELEVLRLLAVGLSTEQIAESIGVSRITARNHITNLITKLGAENRLQAVLYASQRKLI